MATLVLQAAGTALGAVFGPVGTVVGRAAGALVGNAIDRSFFAGDTVREGARLTDLDVQDSRQGAPIPKVFGRSRLSGQVIWATQFEEVVSEEEQGGKGTSSVTTRTYSYFGNFAVAICEGEISHIGRIWADGEEINIEDYTYRIYTGTETQLPDSLIEAKQGANNAPAYRGTAYIVFERMPLTLYGNRIPQLAFEIIRPIGKIEQQITGVALIPGATEFGYDTEEAIEEIAEGEVLSRNRHVFHATTDWEASIDELQAVAPNVSSISFVVTWFGTDLRCGQCELVPKVEVSSRNMQTEDWSVAGIARGDASVLSQINGSPVFGGTPSDVSVIRAIQDMNERGLNIVFNPFIMMDVPADNMLEDPYNPMDNQPPFPWRGRITANRAPGIEGTSDKTNELVSEISTFLNRANGFRRFILHYANLCQQAGGVDTFVICSELRGLTWLRDGEGNHPFVDGLIALAAEVKGILGANTKVTYGADWSEYFGYQPPDGSGDVSYHLDPLWANVNVDAIGIDNYMPLADWRDGELHEDYFPTRQIYDLDYLESNVKGGEGYDWFYASQPDRIEQVRTPITDGAYNKPWVYRFKDLKSWWENQHYNRIGGVEVSTPSPWVPQSKPFWLTEVGCPALDKAANQPNVFFDPKSSESALPYFSNGTRDDAMPRAYLEATYRYWNNPDNNPASVLYGAPMMDTQRMYVWSWDTRPFPAFPSRDDIWSDGENWRYGHWLTGRLGGCALQDLIEEVVHTFTELPVDASRINEVVDGFVITDRTSARGALETLMDVYQVSFIERNGTIIALPAGYGAIAQINQDDLVYLEGRQELGIQREQEAELPSQITLAYQTVDNKYSAATCTTRRLVGQNKRTQAVQVPLVSSYDRILKTTENWLQAQWIARNRFIFALPQSRNEIEVGDVIIIEDNARQYKAQIHRIEEGFERRIEATAVSTTLASGRDTQNDARIVKGERLITIGRPVVEILDLPAFDENTVAHTSKIATYTEPWPGAMAVLVSSGEGGYNARQSIERQASIGKAMQVPQKGPIGIWDENNTLTVTLNKGALSSTTDNLLFAGRNALALKSRNGTWEIIQFSTASLIAPYTWRLSRLLRAQLGTEDAMASGYDEGTRVVILNGAVEELAITREESERGLSIKVGPENKSITDEHFTTIEVTPKRRGLKPLSPVHITAECLISAEDLLVTWARRTRLGGDLWEVSDVPLAEERELYQVDIISPIGTVLRQFHTTSPEVTYTASDQLVDFGSHPNSITMRIAQVSASEGIGLSRLESFQLN